MPETTNNDAPDADRPTSRPGQETAAKPGAAARPPSEVAAERDAVRSVAERALGKPEDPSR